MSQWLDMVASSPTPVDTSGVGWNHYTTSQSTAVDQVGMASAAPKSTDKTMLYLTAAGVAIALYSVLKRGRK